MYGAECVNIRDESRQVQGIKTWTNVTKYGQQWEAAVDEELMGRERKNKTKENKDEVLGETEVGSYQIAAFRLLVLPPIVPFPVWWTNSGWLGGPFSVYAFMILAKPAGSAGPFGPCPEEYAACTWGWESTNWNC